MKLLKRLFHPLMALIGIQLVWVLLVVFWIYWFMGRHKELRELAQRYQFDLAVHGHDWMMLVEGLALLLAILAGVYVIFLYWKRQSDILREQKKFMSQVTHELKSPLASIQLHLETIKLRKPPAEKLERFMDTMLADTDRLNNLISNLLMAAKLEHRGKAGRYPVIDLSELVQRVMTQKRQKLPEGGSLTLEVEPAIRVAADQEGMETVLRNLFENAVLYSPDAPDIAVSLRKSGRQAVLIFRDNGRGIDKKDLKRVFRMFYRVRHPGENIRGTGLGLYIVRSLIREHRGRIAVDSEGLGKGCTFTITLPMA